MTYVKPRLVPLSDVAAYLNVPRGRVENLIADGEMLAVQVGGRGRRLVPIEEVRRYLARTLDDARSE